MSDDTPYHRPRHGGTGTRLHRAWKNMHQRCRNPAYTYYACYGGRGIAICPEWGDFAPFRAWAMANGYTDELTIERRDVDAGYCPSNCCWIPMAEQSLNRTVTRRVAAFGETKPIGTWGLDGRCRVAVRTLYDRFNAGWPAEAAIAEPPRLRRGA